MADDERLGGVVWLRVGLGGHRGKHDARRGERDEQAFGVHGAQPTCDPALEASTPRDHPVAIV